MNEKDETKELESLLNSLVDSDEEISDSSDEVYYAVVDSSDSEEASDEELEDLEKELEKITDSEGIIIPPDPPSDDVVDSYDVNYDDSSEEFSDSSDSLT